VPKSKLERASDAITELDVETARALLSEAGDAPNVALERARLALYVGDCDTAQAILSAPTLAATPEGNMFGSVARSCARALASAPVYEDRERGVLVRHQDPADAALAPYIAEVGARARDALARELGVSLPRPLRVEVVRDLFSLSAVTGLPISAAETTGTVGVARWGRVTLVSPRAARSGYPWEDTLAHEIVHLVVTRASRDNAPLWLQEGVAKRYETRWRGARPFDEAEPYHEEARVALVTGQAIGIDQLGPSIAMLPTPEAAATAYAEVASFVSYFVAQRGAGALELLFHDLRGIGDTDAALRSVTGFDLRVWNALWQRHLLEQTQPDKVPDPALEATVKALKSRAPARPRDIARSVRLADLLARRGHTEHVQQAIAKAREAMPREPSFRWRAARSLLATGEDAQAREALGGLGEVSGLHGGWVGLAARLAEDKERLNFLNLGLALDPLSEDVACEGWFRLRAPPPIFPTAEATRADVDTNKLGRLRPPEPPLPRDPIRRALCQAAREIPSD
jgi:hypothetical protein